ncbi:MAG: SulP family inorganic anion transporter [Hyphomicrobiaceae bacterium]|nr:SulP family inorganic anion transporter [Hyphomicrobiaceae bacterium]
MCNLKGDLFGGLTAAVVALPLALAFGVASGAGPIAGLYGAIAVGFFAAVLGGTPAQVSGPTGPMTVVMAGIIGQYADSPAEAFTIVIFGGALQILFGFARLGRYVEFTPVSVVSGFMSGIGVIIMLIQTLPFFGLAAVSGGPVGAIAAWPRIPSEFNSHALAIAAISLAIMLFWPARLRAYMPPPLAALIVATVLALTVFTRAPVLGDIPTGLPSLIVPDIPWSSLAGFVQAAFILGILGSIDSLLTSLVADSMTGTRHNSNKELIGQGVGNMIAGMIGGLPGAGATMRTVVNIKAGGTTPLSGAVHAFVLLALVAGLAPLASHVPHAALAGILLKVGWDIVDWGFLKRLKRMPRPAVAVMAVTLLLTVFVDLITAVGVGIIMASFVTADWRQTEELGRILRFYSGGMAAAGEVGADPDSLPEQERTLLQQSQGRLLLTRLIGGFSYASARELVARATPLDDDPEIIVFDLSQIGRLDVSAAMAIDELLEKREQDDRILLLAGADVPAAKLLRDLKILDRVPAARRFPDAVAALSAAGKMLRAT